MECECTVDYGSDIDEPIKGKPTDMDYKGNGIWICPACERKEDLSEIVFNVRLQFIKIDGYTEIHIIEPFDKRLMIPIVEKYPDRLKKDGMEDDLNEDFRDDHELGIFDCEILYNWYRCSYEYEEYDLEMFIITEKKVVTGEKYGRN